jgi:hypothetical protein
MNKSGVVFGVLLMLTLYACASSPPPSAQPSGIPASHAPPPTTILAASPQSAPPSSGGVATPAVTTAAAPKPLNIAKLDKAARQMGYQVVLSDGQRYYCRMHADLGTRIEQRECVTQDDFATVLHAQDLNRQNLEAPHICSGPGCAPH